MIMQKKYNLKISAASRTVSMVSLSMNALLKGRCSVNINLLGESYSNIQLSVLPGFCCNIIPGQDFMNHHSSVSFTFGGLRKSLVISSSTACSVPSTSVNSSSLFSNLIPNCKPIVTKSRRFENEDKHFIQSEIHSMLQEGVIEEITSPWRTRVLFVSNERQRKRLVVDYTQPINRFTKLDTYPLPRMEDLASEISQYKFYISLNLKNAYHQIPIREEDKQNSAFEANGNLYQFCSVPFGVTNGVACFQRTIDNIIKQHKLRGTYVYVGNIVVAGKTQQEHDENLTKFRNIAQLHNLTFNE